MDELPQQKNYEQSTYKSSGESDGGILEQARGVASQVADNAKRALGSRLNDRTTKSAMQLSQLADVLRQGGQRLEGNLAGPLMARAAARVESISDALDVNDVRQVVERVESFARREPALFLGGAFAVGLLGARFLRGAAPSSSSLERSPQMARINRPNDAGGLSS
jgi:ElaB/YqjD/DUF883 family membrane-anchored ribosome-binding protein